MRNLIRVMVVIMVFVLFAAPAIAAEKKCNAIPWGEPLTAVEQIEFSHAKGDVRYYDVTKVEACGISEIEDTRVTYGFRQNRLYATIVEIDRAKDVKKVISTMIDEYGLPDIKKDDGWDIYRWENDDLIIKLKSQYTTDRIKIGMYYKPLDAKE